MKRFGVLLLLLFGLSFALPGCEKKAADKGASSTSTADDKKPADDKKADDAKPADDKKAADDKAAPDDAAKQPADAGK